MAFPYQCIEVFDNPLLQSSILLAASGPVLYAFNLAKKQIISKWPCNENQEDDHDSSSSTEIITSANDGAHRSKRRRKNSETGNHQSPLSPDISMLRVSKGGKYIALVTGADKTIHVLELTENGTLEWLNKRQMAKRPCAMCFDSRGEEILCADKFGDVYALPLILKTDSQDEPENGTHNAQDHERPFKPAATALTVHSGRNLRALEAQRLQAPQQPKRREIMTFEHRLLLGHVSMLTDIIVLSTKSPAVEAPDANGHLKTRDYIITADRDEHIRISRANPQSHIIERYCFGHQQFVSCLAEAGPGLMVSGGGDPYLCVWDWESGELLCKLDLWNAVQQSGILEEDTTIDDSSNADSTFATKRDTRIAVTRLICPRSNDPRKDMSTTIHCICERVPAIFTFRLAVGESAFKLHVTPLIGNPLDIAILENSLILSVDCVHERGSTNVMRKSSCQIMLGLQGFRVTKGILSEDDTLQSTLTQLDEQVPKPARSDVDLAIKEESSRIQDLCYGVEKLRKQGIAETEDHNV